MKHTTKAALLGLALTATATQASTINIDVDTTGTGTLGSIGFYDAGNAGNFDDQASAWGDVTANANREGITVQSFEAMDTLDTGGTMTSTFQAGTYTVSLQVGTHNNKAFVGYLDLGSETADTTSEGFTFGLMTAVPTSAETGSSAITAFNNAAGVTFAVTANPAAAKPTEGIAYNTWTFTWDIAEGSAVIGETAHLGALIQNMNNNSALIDNGSITYTAAAVPEPSSTALLGLGGLALIMRRRK